MINKTVYICEYCGKQYDNYDDCKECENSHVKIEKIEIVDAKYKKILPISYNYPTEIKVRVNRSGPEPEYLIYEYSSVANHQNARNLKDKNTW